MYALKKYITCILCNIIMHTYTYIYYIYMYIYVYICIYIHTHYILSLGSVYTLSIQPRWWAGRFTTGSTAAGELPSPHTWRPKRRLNGKIIEVHGGLSMPCLITKGWLFFLFKRVLEKIHHPSLELLHMLVGQILHFFWSTYPGKHTKSYWTWPFIVDLPLKYGDFQ